MESLSIWLPLAQEEAARGSSSIFLPMILIGVLFYFMLLRPEKDKKQKMDQMQNELKKNDRVVTIGGIFGTVVQAGQDSDEVTIRIDENSNTRIRVLRTAISRKIDTGGGSDA